MPEAIKIIKDYKQKLLNKEEIDINKYDSETQNIIVDYNKIVDNSYILRGERYLVGKNLSEDIDTITFGELTTEVKTKSQESDEIYSISNQRGFVKSVEYFNDYFEVEDKSKYNRVEYGTFAFNPARINVGSIALYENEMPGCISPMYKRFKIREEYTEKLDPKYLLAILKSEYAKSYINNKRTGVRGSVDLESLSDLKIPIPSKDKQNLISLKMNMLYSMNVAKENIKFTVLEDKDWPNVPITNLFEFEKGSQQITKNQNGEYSLVTTSSIIGSDHFDYDEEAICVPMISSKGHGVAELKNIFYINGKFCWGDILMVRRKKAGAEFNMKFYYYYLATYLDKYFTRLMTGTSNVGFTIDDMNGIEIPYPAIEEQNRIVEAGKKYEEVISNIEKLEEECNNQIDDMIKDMQQ